MNFKKISSDSKKLLDDILQADNPSDMLSQQFKGLSRKEDEELRCLIKELQENGYIHVSWANNKPYRVIIHNSAKIYAEQLLEYESEKASQKATYVIDQSIKIGNNNRITGVTIAEKIDKQSYNKHSFAEKHPVILSLLISC